MAASRFDKGEKGGTECDRNIDTEEKEMTSDERQDVMQRKQGRDSSHVDFI